MMESSGEISWWTYLMLTQMYLNPTRFPFYTAHHQFFNYQYLYIYIYIYIICIIICIKYTIITIANV